MSVRFHVVFPVVLFCAATVYAEQAWSLEFLPASGQKVGYRITEKISISINEQQLHSQELVFDTTETVLDSNSPRRISIRVNRISTTTDTDDVTRAYWRSIAAGLRFVAHVDNSYSMKTVEAGPGLRKQTHFDYDRLFSGRDVIKPPENVKIGDTWSSTWPCSTDTGSLNVVCRNAMTSVTDIKGMPAGVMSYSGKIHDPRFDIRGTVNGIVVIRLDDGTVIRSMTDIMISSPAQTKGTRRIEKLHREVLMTRIDRPCKKKKTSKVRNHQSIQ